MPYVSAHEYLKYIRRQMPANATLLELATFHAIFNSKRQVRSMVDITAAYHLRKHMTSRDLQAVQ